MRGADQAFNTGFVEIKRPVRGGPRVAPGAALRNQHGRLGVQFVEHGGIRALQPFGGDFAMADIAQGKAEVLPQILKMPHKRIDAGAGRAGHQRLSISIKGRLPPARESDAWFANGGL